MKLMSMNATATHVEMVQHASMESTNTPASACQDSQEFTARQISTNALQILARTEAFALILSTVSNANAQEDITTLAALAMWMSALQILAFTEDAKMVSTSSFAIVHQVTAVNAVKLILTNAVRTHANTAATVTIS